jgi:hypothetical protein
VAVFMGISYARSKSGEPEGNILTTHRMGGDEI